MKKTICCVLIFVMFQTGTSPGVVEIRPWESTWTLSPHTRFDMDFVMMAPGDEGVGSPAGDIFKSNAALMYARDLIVKIIATNGPQISGNVVRNVLSRHMENIPSGKFDAAGFRKQGREFFLPYTDFSTGESMVVKFSVRDNVKIPLSSDIRVSVSPVSDIFDKSYSAERKPAPADVARSFEEEMKRLERTFRFLEQEVGGVTFGWYYKGYRKKNLITCEDESYMSDMDHARQIRHKLHMFFPLKRKLIISYASRKRIKRTLDALDGLKSLKRADRKTAYELTKGIMWLKELKDPGIDAIVHKIESSGYKDNIDNVLAHRRDLGDILNRIDRNISVLRNKTEAMLTFLETNYFAEKDSIESGEADDGQMDIFRGMVIDTRGIKRAADKAQKILRDDIFGFSEEEREAYRQRYLNILRMWKRLYGKVDQKYLRDKRTVHVGVGVFSGISAVDKALGTHVSSFSWGKVPEELGGAVDTVILDNYSQLENNRFIDEIRTLLGHLSGKGVVFFADGSSEKVRIFLEEAHTAGVRLTKERDMIPSTGGKEAVMYSFTAEHPFEADTDQMDLFRDLSGREDIPDPAVTEKELDVVSVEDRVMELADLIREKAISLREEGRTLFVGIDTSWLPAGHTDMSGVNALLRGFERIKGIYGLDNIVVKTGSGDDLAHSMDAAVIVREKESGYKHRLSDVFIVGSADIPGRRSFAGYRPGKQDGAFFAEISLKSQPSLGDYIGLIDILRAAISLSRGPSLSAFPENEFIKVKKIPGRERFFVFEIIPDCQRFDPSEINDRYRRELEFLIRA